MARSEPSEERAIDGAGAMMRRWFQETRASVDHAEVVERVRADAGWSSHFLVMTLLSAGIAILGMLLSSPAVVIGAMLISPLMGPIIGAGFGLATFDSVEIRRAAIALVVGTVLAVGFCAVIVLLSPIQTVTSEVAARTRPNLFDLMIALLSGFAGTYAVIRGRHGAIVGVAIATALMPPLAAMGFGLATTNRAVLSGSALLFLTNLMTIAAAAAALARFYGFATDLSPHHTRLQLLLFVGTLAVFAIPLGLALKNIAWQSYAQHEAQTTIADAFGDKARVSDVKVHFHSEPLRIEATVLTPTYKRGVEQSVARELEKSIGEKVALAIDQVHTSDGDSAALDVAQPSAAERASSRMTQEIAVIAGVPAEDVLVDSDHSRVQARAAALPGATLATYREMERRLGQAEPGWSIELIPPVLPPPQDGADDALSTTAWAAARLHLGIVVDGGSAATAANALKEQGVAVQRGRKSGPLKLSWATSAAPTSEQTSASGDATKD